METTTQIIIIYDFDHSLQIMVSLKSPTPTNDFYMSKGYELTINKVAKQLKTNVEKGLKEKEVKLRSQSVGLNEIITPKQSVWKLYLAPLFDTLIVIYLIMTGIMLLLSIQVPEIRSKVAFWLVLIAFNMMLAIFQQFRAQKKIEALQQLSPPRATVIRNGKKREIIARELVPGDIIDLSLGDRIPADARIIKSSNLTVNEASLTGESLPADKMRDGTDAIEDDSPIGEHKNMLYLGTFIQTGSARAIIVRTGNDTELGKIASAMSNIDIEIPLRKRVNALGKWLGIIMVVFLLILISFVSYDRITSDEPFTSEQFAFDISQAIINAMAVLPINIPLLTTVILITGVLNMAKNKVVIKELSVVETLGRCSVLCSDKTGTMTTSRMTVKLLYDTENYFFVTLRNNYRNALCLIPEEEVDTVLDSQVEDHEDIDIIESNSSLDLLLAGAILNNEASIVPLTDERERKDREWEIIGNPTDGALLVLAMTNGLNVDTIRERYVKERTYPFDSTVKRMSGLFKDTLENDYMVLTKGATEVLLPRCNYIGNEFNKRKLTKKEKENIQNRVDGFANSGYRVISLAYKAINDLPKMVDLEGEREMVESDLIYNGFTIIYDPPRPGVLRAVNELDKAGIFPIMITGDAPTTAATIARQVGILDPDEIVIEGREAEDLPDEEFFKVSVFARVSPQHKEIIVSRYQQRGDVVAMTGDGVNDALAISKSDAGVAMGITGTEVAKEAADIIITDDSYVSLVGGVEEGRNLYEKIRMLIFFYIAVNFAEAIVYFSTSFIIDFQILNNWQRVYIFSIIHAIPVLAIIFGPPDKDIMQLKPRDNDALLSKRLIVGLTIYAISFATMLLSMYFLYYNGDLPTNSFNEGGIWKSLTTLPTGTTDPEELLLPENLAHAKARTIMLTMIYISESLLVLSIRRINVSTVDGSLNNSNFLVWTLVFVGMIMHFALMYITPYQEAFSSAGIQVELIRLGFFDLILTITAAFIPLLLLEWYKKYNRDREIQL
ncbi:MAG: cation-transporting P-type ATPase [Candidatus Heimdallarchaeota archaeon]|nr:cation-transporting P-type ATPase [Candidatus Heimdallarchaeota archaeon]